MAAVEDMRAKSNSKIGKGLFSKHNFGSKSCGDSKLNKTCETVENPELMKTVVFTP